VLVGGHTVVEVVHPGVALGVTSQVYFTMMYRVFAKYGECKVSFL
jgi:hypothetical protein